jgi:hypothetical protein
MSRFARWADEFLRKMETNATAEALRLGKNAVRNRLIGTAIGIIVVILIFLWMEYH